tara:strand:- start:1343 stop:1576 length:234 start_codon:yes stop_codon:yes gene_type:complete
MANRHKVAKKNVGGAMVASGNPKVIAEAKKKATGGAVEKKAEGGKVVGKASGGRLDKRARGGGVGADKNPFSSAKIS